MKSLAPGAPLGPGVRPASRFWKMAIPSSPLLRCSLFQSLAAGKLVAAFFALAACASAQELFVTGQTADTACSGLGFIIESNGSLTPVANPTPLQLPACGTLIPAPSGRFVYGLNGTYPVTYAVSPNTGVFQSPPVATGPVAIPSHPYLTNMALDPSGQYLYAQATDGIVEYAVNPATGALSYTPGDVLATAALPFTGLTVAVNNRLYVITGTVNSLPSYIEGFTVNLPESTEPLSTDFGEIPGLPLQVTPQLVTLSADSLGRFLFAQSSNAFAPNSSGILVYQIDASGGKLTLTPGSPFHASLYDSQFASDPSGRFLYVAAGTSIFGFTVNAASGALTAMLGSPFSSAGEYITALVIDPSGQFLYDASLAYNGIIGYSINPTTGSLTPLPGSPFPTTLAPQNLSTGTFPASRLNVSLLTESVSGEVLTVTVTAQDRWGKTVRRYPDSVHFTSSDSNAILPPDSILTAGAGAFNVTFKTPGAQTLSVIDIESPSVMGNAVVAVASNITVVNAASLKPGSVAPNTIVSLFGQFSGCGTGTAVTVNGFPSTMFYASSTQINLLIPADIAGAANASIQVVCNGVSYIAAGIPIVVAAPALFTSGAAGSGQLALVNQSGAVDSPCSPGSVVQIYGTGFGPLKTPDSSGLANLLLPVTATIGNTPATVIFAGQAPGFTTGLQQIDVLIPANVPAGTATLVLAAGGNATQSGATLVID
jgi:6-phosphogluconolactonase